MALDIFAANLSARFVVLTDGRLADITNFFDQFGEECDPEDAVTCVVKVDDDCWLTVDLRECESVSTH